MEKLILKRISIYRGIILSVTASCLFAAQYYLAALVPDMSGGEMFGWRTMIAFPFVTVCSGDYLMVAFIGIISAGAFMSYITASRHFSFSLFGLMGFVEPVLLVIVSLLLGKI